MPCSCMLPGYKTTGVLAQALVARLRQLLRAQPCPGDPKRSCEQLHRAQRVLWQQGVPFDALFTVKWRNV
jgi:hypothetical protein